MGFTSSFAVVLTGLHAVGASAEQAASGLLALSLTMGAACIILAWRFRMPITSAWSTPGAALLAAISTVEGRWPAAVGAFIATAALILLTALVPQLGALIAAIPPSIAQAMLAGVLLPLCLAPVTGIVDNPWGVVPVVLTWLIVSRLAPRWAVPAAFLTATAVVVVGVVTSETQESAPSILPVLTLTAPTFTFGAIVGIALPLFIVDRRRLDGRLVPRARCVLVAVRRPRAARAVSRDPRRRGAGAVRCVRVGHPAGDRRPRRADAGRRDVPRRRIRSRPARHQRRLLSAGRRPARARRAASRASLTGIRRQGYAARRSRRIRRPGDARHHRPSLA